MQQIYFDNFDFFCDYFEITNVVKQKSFIEATTHASFCKKTNYERMEFLGDTILNFCISKIIFEEFPKENEGFLSKRKSFLCSRKVCCEVAKSIHLDEKIIYSHRSNVDVDSIVGNVLESFLCCIFYEYGIDKIYQIVYALFSQYLYTQDISNSKIILQEIMQKRYKILPKYEVISKEGTENHPFFSVKVMCNGIETYGEGTSKKDAEKMAAYNMLKVLNSDKCKNSDKKRNFKK